MASQINPYASPVESPRDATVVADLADAEMIRRQHAKHELGVRQIGALYYLGGLFALIVACVGPFVYAQPSANIPTGQDRGMPSAVTAVFVVILLAIAVVQLLIGWGLRRIRPWSRWPLVIVSAVTLLNPPFGTALGAYGLYLAVSQKGTVVFSPGYQQIMAQTPHLRPKTSVVVKVLVVLLVALVAFSLAAFLGLSVLERG